MARIIDGKAEAALVREEVAKRAAEFTRTHKRAPCLQVILAGDDPASQVYVRNKEQAARAAGFAGGVLRLPASASEQEILAQVRRCNEDPAVDGILVQLPLPGGISEKAVLAAVDPSKDVDGFHAVNVGALWSGTPGLAPCTPQGCMRLLKAAEVKIEGAHAVVIGRSNIVGKPMAALLLQANATVTIAHSRTKDLPALCRTADILIAAIGKPRFVGAEFIKPGAAVIDVGMNRDAQGKLCGDVDFDAVSPIAGAITPVPGGVGPMTIALLLENTVMAANARVSSR
ncbi:MAG TPA: bifunctional methylenetetrahydrofolate dehydrogenase/methenyltetrahydrofolate cyclohydrolase FolD [Polyangiaceae bacterium]|nr:bifunctional methylenetetrahydrofolate dehydrogenase/methenyltetrahydrofolate cyclohydrolase FolD [Polyangiaceae bacterium]